MLCSDFSVLDNSLLVLLLLRRNPWQTQLKEGRVYFGSRFEGAVHHQEGGAVAGLEAAGGGGDSGSRESWMLSRYSHLPSTQDLKPWSDQRHLQLAWDASLSWIQSGKILRDIPRGLFSRWFWILSSWQAVLPTWCLSSAPGFHAG